MNWTDKKDRTDRMNWTDWNWTNRKEWTDPTGGRESDTTGLGPEFEDPSTLGEWNSEGSSTRIPVRGGTSRVRAKIPL